MARATLRTDDNEGVVGPGSVVTLRASCAAAQPITFMAQHRGRAVLDSSNTTTDATCNGAPAYFNLARAAYVVIEGFVITRGCVEGAHSDDAAHDVTLRWARSNAAPDRTGRACSGACARDSGSERRIRVIALGAPGHNDSAR